jgi:hypothetical protein
MEEETLRQVFGGSGFESLSAKAGVNRRPVATAKHFECAARIRGGARGKHDPPTGFWEPVTRWRATLLVTHGAILGRSGRSQHTSPSRYVGAGGGYCFLGDFP